MRRSTANRALELLRGPSGTRRESNGANRGYRQTAKAILTAENRDLLARETIDRTMCLFEAVEAPAGEMPVVLAAGYGGILVHEAMGHGFEADFIRKGTSVFTGRLGELCAPESVSIVDTGCRDLDWGAVNVDDEGTPGQETLLVDHGRLTSWMHDRLSAQHFGVAPAGNARRQDYRQLPLPRMRCTYLSGGDCAKDDIIRSVRRGLYAEQFTNGQVNIGPGDFTFYMKYGWLIEDGKLTRPIKDVNLIGNGPKVLSEVEMVGNDLWVPPWQGSCGKNGQSVPVSDGMPTVKVRSITVGGRA
jgi:TldD protein